MIDDVSITSPTSGMPVVEIYNYNGNGLYEYYNGNNAKVFQMSIVFNYLEIINGDTSDVCKSIVWDQGKEYKTTDAATKVTGRFSVLAFYT